MNQHFAARKQPALRSDMFAIWAFAYMLLVAPFGAATMAATQWPLKVSVDGRSFVQQDGSPYFPIIDTEEFPNIVWCLGGDKGMFRQKNLDRPMQIEAGRRLRRLMDARGDRRLIGEHPGRGSSVINYTPEEAAGWLDFYTVQSGHRGPTQDVPDWLRQAYERRPVKPVFDGEPLYEAHNPGVENAEVRWAHWVSVFSGACAASYGCQGFWGIGTEVPDRPTRPGHDSVWWKQHLDDQPVAHQMQYFETLNRAYPFHRAVPDYALEAPLINDRGQAGDYKAALVAKDRTWALVYLPSGPQAGRVTVRMDWFHGPVRARWFDPTSGAWTESTESFDNLGRREFRPSARNQAGQWDWVLVLTRGAFRTGSGIQEADQREVRSQLCGVLRVHPTNPRYFTDDSGKAVYLTGWNVWGNLQDGHGWAWWYGWGNPFDYQAYLDSLSAHHLNYIRLWMYETAMMTFNAGKSGPAPPTERPSPMPWRRTGPGIANDGKLRFDLTRFDPAYFGRLRSRVVVAGDCGIYVSIMLFEGFSVRKDRWLGKQGGWVIEQDGWVGHPFHKDNNINGIDGDPNGDGSGNEVHTLQVPDITKLQEVYVRQVIDTVNDLDNVVFEVANESGGTAQWQYHVIDVIKRYELEKPKQHPVQMTGAGAMKTLDLYASSAEAIGPVDGQATSATGPAAADGRKVIIADTDHLGAIAMDRTLLALSDPDAVHKMVAAWRSWIWRSFTRGYNPVLLMRAPGFGGGEAGLRALGGTRRYAERMNLGAMTPHGELASTQYCLAQPGREYLVYLPHGGEVTVDLTAASGPMEVEWFDPQTHARSRAGVTEGGDHRSFTAPFEGDAVLYLIGRSSSNR